MKLSEYKKISNKYSGKASDITRHLALAGVAIIWIFHIEENGKIKIDRFLIYPLIFLAIALISDLLQYVIASKIWMNFFLKNEKLILNRTHEDPINTSEPDIKAPRYLNKPIYIFYYIKIALMVLSYFMIIIYLLRL